MDFSKLPPFFRIIKHRPFKSNKSFHQQYLDENCLRPTSCLYPCDTYYFSPSQVSQVSSVDTLELKSRCYNGSSTDEDDNQDDSDSDRGDQDQEMQQEEEEEEEDGEKTPTNDDEYDEPLDEDYPLHSCVDTSLTTPTTTIKLIHSTPIPKTHGPTQSQTQSFETLAREFDSLVLSPIGKKSKIKTGMDKELDVISNVRDVSTQTLTHVSESHMTKDDATQCDDSMSMEKVDEITQTEMDINKDEWTQVTPEGQKSYVHVEIRDIAQEEEQEEESDPEDPFPRRKKSEKRC